MKNVYLAVKNVSKSYGVGEVKVLALDNVSFEVSEGEIVLIMGPSGSGKTTLLTILGTLLTPDSGQVFYGNTETTNLSLAQKSDLRAKNIGFIFQSFNLLSALSVWENVALVLEMNGIKGSEAKNRAHYILTELGLAKRQIYSVLDLSGGEKQRVSLARAVISNPKMILADEPTANLDSKSGHKVLEILNHMAKKHQISVVIVSHDMRLLDIADRVLWLEDGKIKEGGEQIVLDPICKMPLEVRLAPYNLKYQGQTYYFCSQKCFNDFKTLKKIEE